MEEQVVYKASPGTPARQVLTLLRSKGLAAKMLDPPDPDPNLQFAAGGTYKVRIAVPPEQVERATAILKTREAQRAAVVDWATGQFRRDLLLGLAIGICATIVWLLWSRALPDLPASTLPVLLVSTLLATMAIGQIRQYRQQKQRVSRAHCEVCNYSLRGLTEPRCPECGFPFDPKLLSPADEESSDEDD